MTAIEPLTTGEPHRGTRERHTDIGLAWYHEMLGRHLSENLLLSLKSMLSAGAFGAGYPVYGLRLIDPNHPQPFGQWTRSQLGEELRPILEALSRRAREISNVDPIEELLEDPNPQPVSGDWLRRVASYRAIEDPDFEWSWFGEED